MVTPVLADDGRTGRGADADGGAAAHAEREAQGRRDQGATILMMSALVEQLVTEGALSREGAARVLERAKALSAARVPHAEAGQQQ
jgi:hypothetical protein